MTINRRLLEMQKHLISSNTRWCLERPGVKPSVYLCDGGLPDFERAAAPSINACEEAAERCALPNDVVPRRDYAAYAASTWNTHLAVPAMRPAERLRPPPSTLELPQNPLR